MAAYRKYLRDLVDAKARAPGDDLTSDLIAIHREAPERLTLDEIASILFSLSFAGHETTTGLIGNTVRRLLEEPARWAEIAAQPELIPGAVDETLRYDPVGPGLAPGHHAPGHPGRRRPARGRQALPVAGRRRPRRGSVRPPRRLRPAPNGCRPAPGVRQGPALLPGREPRQARGADRGRRTHPPLPRPAAGAGPAADLPPQHLVPRPPGPAGPHEMALVAYRAPLGVRVLVVELVTRDGERRRDVDDLRIRRGRRSGRAGGAARLAAATAAASAAAAEARVRASSRRSASALPASYSKAR